MRVVRDTIPVKGRAARRASSSKYTRHGPVLYEDRRATRPYALRAAWLESGSRPISPACGWTRRALGGVPRGLRLQPHARPRTWCGPIATGNIGWQAVGIAPLRAQLERPACPCRATAATSGTASFPITALPHVVNPPRGFFATANNYLFPHDYPHPDAVHYTWADPYRAVAHRRGARLGAAVHGGRHDAAAARRALDAGARAGAAAERPAALESHVGPGARRARRLGLRGRQGLRRRRHLRDVAALRVGERARP